MADSESDPRLKRRLFVMRLAGYTSAVAAVVTAAAVATATPAQAMDADPNDPNDNDPTDGFRRNQRRQAPPRRQQRSRGRSDGSDNDRYDRADND